MATQDSLLEYSFSFDSLLDEIMRVNQLRVKEIYDKDNNILFENYSITESDADTVVLFIKNAVFELVDISLPLMSGVTGAVKTENPYGVIVNNNGNANEAAKESLENAFKQVIVLSVLAQWYEIKGLSEEFKLWNMKLDRLKTDVAKRRITQLKIR